MSMWGWLVVAYLFLGGLGAGLFTVCAMLQLAHGGRYMHVARCGVAVALCCLIIGALCLLADVAQPVRALHVFESFSNVASSWMARGVWIIVANVAVYALWLAVSCLVPRRRGWAAVLNVVGCVGTAAALALALYTGLLLHAALGVPAWRTWHVPALFTVSALDTGLCAASGLLHWRPRPWYLPATARMVDAATVGLMAIEAAVAVAYAAYLKGGALTGPALVVALQDVRVVCCASVFVAALLGALVLGALRLALPKVQGRFAGATVACGLLAGCMLRAAVMYAGVHMSEAGFVSLAPVW